MGSFGGKAAEAAQEKNDALCVAEHGGRPCRTFDDMRTRHRSWQAGYVEGMRQRRER